MLLQHAEISKLCKGLPPHLHSSTLLAISSSFYKGAGLEDRKGIKEMTLQLLNLRHPINTAQKPEHLHLSKQLWCSGERIRVLETVFKNLQYNGGEGYPDTSLYRFSFWWFCSSVNSTNNDNNQRKEKLGGEKEEFTPLRSKHHLKNKYTPIQLILFSE